MKTRLRYLYYLGSFLLFIGLLWMFLPHAFHQKILSEKEDVEHLIHIFQGLIFVVIGLALMILSNRYKKKKQ